MSKPDITYATNNVAEFLQKWQKDNYNEAKDVFQNLQSAQKFVV